jgi:hypothetical protein
MNNLIQGLAVFIIFLGFSSPIIIIGIVCYFVKRLKHKQIMAAIEKGADLSKLDISEKPKKAGPLWIKNLTAGISLLIIAVGIVCLRLARIHGGGASYNQTIGYFAVALIFFANGISHLIRGLLQRKVLDQNGNGNGAAEPVSPGGEASQQ